MNYWFTYDKTNGTVYPAPIGEQAPQVSEMGVLGPYDQSTASPTVVMAYTYPERYLAQGSPAALVEQPYFTVAAVESTTVTNQWVVTATLNNPSATPPTNATITINGTTETVALTTIAPFTATLTVGVHASLVNATIHVTAGATGCATSRPVSIGGNTQSSVALQVYTPPGGAPTVAPTGPGSKTFLASFYALSPATLQALLADIGTAVSLLTDVVFNVLLPASTATLTANQQNAVADIKANVLPNLYTTLANAYPSGGAKQLQYQDYAADLAKSFKAYEQYMADLQSIPELM